MYSADIYFLVHVTSNVVIFLVTSPCVVTYLAVFVMTTWSRLEGIL